jgi:hypothetical protein
MSYLQKCLTILGITDDFSKIDSKYLKNVFKTKVLESHPDKSGSNEDFDNVLSAFLHLQEINKRLKGGRDVLNEIISPDVIKSSRSNELINSIFQEIDNEEFNKKFEESHVSELGHGYQDWLKQESQTPKKSESGNSETESEITPENFNSVFFNSVFKKSAKVGKPEVAHNSIICINSMGITNSIGSELIQSEIQEYSSTFPSELQYSDVYTAFNNSTVIDKLPSNDNIDDVMRNFDKLKEIREQQIKPTEDEIDQLLQFEKEQFEKEKKHRDNLIKSFGENAFGVNTICNTEPLTNDNYSGNIIITPYSLQIVKDVK